MRSRARAGDVLASFDTFFQRRAECEHQDRPHYGGGFCRSCYDKQARKAKKKGIIYSKRQKQPEALVQKHSFVVPEAQAKVYDEVFQEPQETAEQQEARIAAVAAKQAEEILSRLSPEARERFQKKQPAPRPVVSKEEGARQIATVIANLNGTKPPAPRVSQHPEDCDWSDD